MSKKCVVNRNEDGIITSVEVKNISYSNENSITDSSVNNINNDKYNYAVNSNNGNDLDIAPNGKPSLLYKSYIDLGYSEIEAKNLVSEVYTDEFKKWFGDWQNDPENSSKVVDENGQPKIVWSGNTSSILGKNINNSVFQGYRIYGNEYNNFEKDGHNTENYRFSNTALFVEDKKLATTYATGINAFRTPANIINKYAPKDSFLEPIFLNVRNYEEVDEVSNKIIPRIDSSIQEGIDGFYGGNRGEYSEYKTWAILDADQARSAKHISFQTEENVLVGAVINTLKNKGLVSDVKLLSNNEMTSKLIELGVPESVITNKDQEALNTELSERGLKSIVGGFYKKDTRQIFLNKDSNNLLNTTIHEFSHPMIEWLIENRKDLFNSGIDLLKNNKNEIVNYIKRVDTLYPNIRKNSDAYWEEVMAEIIANNGVDLINKEKKSNIKEWLDHLWETFKSMIGITGYTAEDVSNMTVKEFANAVNAEMFNEVSLDTLLRVGRNIGYQFDTELTARERFNISKLKRINAGSDRIVYELDDNKVIKIAKTARGLMQNIYEGSYDLVEEELLPDIYETGLNYVIVEKVSPIKAKDLVPTYDVEGEQIGTEKAEKMFADFSKFSQIDFDNSSQKLIDTLYKYGMFYILNREVLFGDFSRKANWGIKNGKPIHLDGGTFAGTRLLSEYRGKSNLEDEDFKEAYNRSKSFKKIIGDRDRNTMFRLIDNSEIQANRSEVYNKGIEPVKAEVEKFDIDYELIEKSVKDLNRNNLNPANDFQNRLINPAPSMQAEGGNELLDIEEVIKGNKPLFVSDSQTKIPGHIKLSKGIISKQVQWSDGRKVIAVGTKEKIDQFQEIQNNFGNLPVIHALNGLMLGYEIESVVAHMYQQGMNTKTIKYLIEKRIPEIFKEYGIEFYPSSQIQSTIDYVRNNQDFNPNGSAVQFQKGNQRLTPITKQAFDSLVTKLQKAFPGFAKVTYDFEAFKKQAEKLGATFNDIQRMVMALHGSPHSFPKEILVENELGEREYLVGDSDSFPEVPKGYKVIEKFPFGRFRLDKIGTGEGAQAFGWGLYFTDLESIARNYASKLSKIKHIYQTIPSKMADDLNELGVGGSSLSDKETLLDNIKYRLRRLKSDIYDFENGSLEEDFKDLKDDWYELKEFYSKNYKFSKHSEKYQKISDLYTENFTLDDFIKIQNLHNEIFQEDITQLEEFKGYIENLPEKQKPTRALYNVTLHKGKQPSEYTWLEWDREVPKNLVNNIRELEKELFDIIGTNLDSSGDKIDIIEYTYGKSGEGVYDIFESIDEEDNFIDRLGKNVYQNLDNILFDSKQASLLLLKYGIDGIKYPAESLSRGATSDNARGFNYVVFDENAITIEDKIQFMQTPNGTIYGAKLPDGTIYLNSEFLNANTPIHEFSHLFEQLLPSRFKSGIELLKQTDLGKKLFEQLKQEGNYVNLTDEQLWGEALNTHIGNFGENEVNNPKGKLKQLQDWIKDFFAKVGDLLGIKKLSPDTQLRMFTEGVVKDLLGGKPIVAENQVSPSEQVQYSFLTENDYDANGNIKPEVLAEIQAEREAIKSEAQSNGTFMKAPNGNATNLNEAQWIDVRTKRFKDWFGDWQNDAENASKVVDENGEPLVVQEVFINSKYEIIKEC